MSNKLLYQMERPIYSFDELKKVYKEEKNEFNLINSIKYKLRCDKTSVSSTLKKIMPLPFILLSFYTWKFLIMDILAGFTMLVFHIPQGLAYGLLSGLQPINGLYTSFFPPLVYTFFGTSRHISIGTFSVMSILSRVSVLREASLIYKDPINETDYKSIVNINSTMQPDINEDFEVIKLQITISTLLLAGIIQVLLGLLKFGYLVNFMSDALIDGFTSAAAIHVIMSQMSNILGYSVTSYSGIGEIPYKVYKYIRNISQTSLPALLLCTGCVVILVVVSECINPPFKRKFRFPIPIQLILVILGTVISYYADLNKKYKIKIVGPIPRGLPYPMIPRIQYWPDIFYDAILLAVIGFVMNSSLAKVYSLKFSYDVDYNQEAIAYGLSNIAGSFFKCVMSAAALARSAVAVEVGMKSQVASLVSCGFMILVISFISPLFRTVPRVVLSAIICVSLKGLLMNLSNLPSLWNVSKYDFLVWIVTYISTIFFNVPFGLVSGFLFSLLTVLMRIQTPKSQILGRFPGTDIYKNTKVFKDVEEIPGIKIFRYDAPLYFANSEHFQQKLYKKSGVDPTKPYTVKVSYEKEKTNQNDLLENNVEERLSKDRNDDLKFIIIDCRATNYLDSVGVRILDDVCKAYKKIGIRVFLAAPNHYIRAMLKRANFAEENLYRIIFVTVHDAVLSTSLDFYQERS